MWQAPRVRLVRYVVFVGVLAVSAGAVGCSDPCDTDAISEELGAATGAGTVTLPECTLLGTVTVPPGVTLVGAGDASRIELGASDGPVILQSGGAPAKLANLAVSRRGGGVAIESAGTQSVILEDVDVYVDEGTGIVFDGLVSATLTRVDVLGTSICGGANTGSTHGIRMTDVSDAQLEDVTVQRFSVAGVALVDTTLSWNGGDANDNMNVGVYAQSGVVTMDDVELDRTCAAPARPHGYAAYFDGPVTVDTQSLRVRDNEGFGLVHAGAATSRPLASHLALTAEDNDKPAVWAQSADALEISGSLARNGSGGVVAIDGASVMLHDLEVLETRTVRLVLETTSVPFGDGIQLVNSAQGATIERVQIDDSGRAGLLIDLAGQTLQATITDVFVTVPPATVGARAQNGVAPPGWDNGINRTGSNSMTDNDPMNPQDPTGVIGPCEQPAI